MDKEYHCICIIIFVGSQKGLKKLKQKKKKPVNSVGRQKSTGKVYEETWGEQGENNGKPYAVCTVLVLDQSKRGNKGVLKGAP